MPRDDHRRRRRVSEAVIEAVARAEGVDETAVGTPLYDVVDPEALDALFELSVPSRERCICVEFEFQDYRVSVEPDCTVTVEPVAEAGRLD